MDEARAMAGVAEEPAVGALHTNGNGMEFEARPAAPQWLLVVDLLVRRRRLLFRAAACGFLLSLALAFLLPKEYRSTVRLMPPEAQSGTGAMLAALAGRAGPAAGALLGGLPGMKNTGALFVDLLRGRTVQQRLAERFELQKVYGMRYQQDAIKKLNARTEIAEDRKSGVVTITVTDRDRARAQRMAAAYVEELDRLVAAVSTSSARRQRVFIEQRLASVKQELESAELQLSEFSSRNMTLDVKDQTKAMVEAGATLQAQLIAAQAELSGLRQAYGDENVRVRAARARIAGLQAQMRKFGGTGAAPGGGAAELYPPLKQLPALGVRWADLYRNVKVQETVFELLTQQYELAKIEEAKEIPTVQVADAANWPEKKSWPPRTLLIALLTLAAVCASAAWILAAQLWEQMQHDDPRKRMLANSWDVLRHRRWRTMLG